MAEFALSQRGKLYAEADAVQLIEEDATAANALNAIRNLQTLAKPGDVCWLNWSSHGGHPQGGEYHLQAYDRQVAWSEIREEPRKVPGFVIVTLDTCHCGMASGDNLIVFASCLEQEGSRAVLWARTACSRSVCLKLCGCGRCERRRHLDAVGNRNERFQRPASLTPIKP